MQTRREQAKWRYYSLFVDNIPPKTLIKKLRNTFQQIGEVSDIYISRKVRRLTTMHFGFIWYDNLILLIKQ
jgi:RNA recognition motif-containing protein